MLAGSGVLSQLAQEEPLKPYVVPISVAAGFLVELAGSAADATGGQLPELLPSLHNDHIARAIGLTIGAVCEHSGHSKVICKLVPDVFVNLSKTEDLGPLNWDEVGHLFKLDSNQDVESMFSQSPLSESEWMELLQKLVPNADDSVKAAAAERLHEQFVFDFFTTLAQDLPDTSEARRKLALLRDVELHQTVKQGKAIWERFEAGVKSQTALIEQIIRGQQSQYTPPRAVIKKEKDPDRVVFAYSSEITRYQERTSVQDAVNQWLNGAKLDKPDFSWLTVVGRAGQGKSRFALHQIQRLARRRANRPDDPNEWDAFFFDSFVGANYDGWPYWQPERPTLIIFDYAYRDYADVQTAINNLHSRAEQGDLGQPVRVLLMERDQLMRIVQSKFESLPGRYRPPRTTTGSAREIMKNLGEDSKFLELEPLRVAELAEVFQDSYSSFGGQAEVSAEAEAQALMDAQLGTPLFTMLRAFQLAADPFAPLDLTTAIELLFKKEWVKLPPEFVEQVAFGVAAASVVKTAKRSDLVSYGSIAFDLSQVAQPSLNEAFAAGFASFASAGPDALTLVAAQPDILAEGFVLAILTGKIGSDQLRLALEEFIKHNRELPEVADFGARCVQNYPAQAEGCLSPLLPHQDEAAWLQIAIALASGKLTLTQIKEYVDRAITDLPDSAILMAGFADSEALINPDLAREAQRFYEGARRTGQASVLNGFWAGALYNASNRLASTDRGVWPLADLEALFRVHGESDAAVRENWAKALFNVSVRLKSTDRAVWPLADLEAMFQAYGESDAAVREQWAKALYNARNDLKSTDRAVWPLADLEALFRVHGESDAAVRENWAKALFNVSVRLKSTDRGVWPLADLDAMFQAYGDSDPAVRESWAMALYNASIDLESTDRAAWPLADLEALFRAYGESDAAVRERWAKALYNASIDLESTDRAIWPLHDLEELFRAYGDSDPAVRERWAKALYNVSVRLGSTDRAAWPLADLEALFRAYGESDAAVRERWAQALVNASILLRSTDRAVWPLQDLEALYQAYGDSDPAVRNQWAFALARVAIVHYPDDFSHPVWRELRDLMTQYPETIDAIESLHPGTGEILEHGFAQIPEDDEPEDES